MPCVYGVSAFCFTFLGVSGRGRGLYLVSSFYIEFVRMLVSFRFIPERASSMQSKQKDLNSLDLACQVRCARHEFSTRREKFCHTSEEKLRRVRAKILTHRNSKRSIVILEKGGVWRTRPLGALQIDPPAYLESLRLLALVLRSICAHELRLGFARYLVPELNRWVYACLSSYCWCLSGFPEFVSIKIGRCLLFVRAFCRSRCFLRSLHGNCTIHVA